MFLEICKIYSDIGLSLEAEKCDVLNFNEIDTTRSDNIFIDLGGTGVKTCVKLKYLGLPIGKNLKKNRLLMLESMETKIRCAYGTLASSQFHLNRAHIVTIQNSVVLPHILYLVPFYPIFSESDHLRTKHVFFKFLEFLVRVPPWNHNSCLMKKYSSSDPCAKLAELNVHMCHKQTGHEWQNAVFLLGIIFVCILECNYDILFISYFLLFFNVLHYFLILYDGL